ncbi:helix-turn-helix domain-containing protein [Lachnoclostridium sp.]|uniref:helix-turn-helix domain-containing protein n=1 Tax=Lachnoclostridium sp. TaxID=2028282 RepID=UPI002897D9C5|nr:helix-turn-helix transcriptional regulator [Lachnoclostridium sp.]
MFDYVEFGNRMFIARMRKNMKQHEVAKALSLAQSSYSEIESGKREINLTQLFTIADALDVSVNYLLGLDNTSYQFSESDLLKIEEYKMFLLSQKHK